MGFLWDNFFFCGRSEPVRKSQVQTTTSGGRFKCQRVTVTGYNGPPPRETERRRATPNPDRLVFFSRSRLVYQLCRLTPTAWEISRKGPDPPVKVIGMKICFFRSSCGLTPNVWEISRNAHVTRGATAVVWCSHSPAFLPSSLRWFATLVCLACVCVVMCIPGLPTPNATAITPTDCRC